MTTKYIFVLILLELIMYCHSLRLNVVFKYDSMVNHGREKGFSKTFAQKFTKGIRLRGTLIYFYHFLMLYFYQNWFFLDDDILDSKTTERNHVQRQAVVKTFFTFPSPPLTQYNGKIITYLETLVTSDSMNVDVDVFTGGIGKDKLILVVTGYNAQVLNTKATIYGIDVKLNETVFVWKLREVFQ